MFDACKLHRHTRVVRLYFPTTENNMFPNYYKISKEKNNIRSINNEYGIHVVESPVFMKWKLSCNLNHKSAFMNIHAPIILSLQEKIQSKTKNIPFDAVKYQGMFRLVKETILEPFFAIPGKYNCKYDLACWRIRMFYDENKNVSIHGDQPLIVTLEFRDYMIMLCISIKCLEKYSEWYARHALHLRDVPFKNECSNWTNVCAKCVEQMDDIISKLP
jgi:hypothetical protein